MITAPNTPPSRSSDQNTSWVAGVVTILVGLMILGSVTDAMAWGSKGHRIIGLIARELLLPETSAAIETIMGSADLAAFGLYLDDNKDWLDQQIRGSRAWHYDNIPLCGVFARARNDRGCLAMHAPGPPPSP